MNISTEQKQTHIHGEQTCCQGGGGRSGMDWESGQASVNFLYVYHREKKIGGSSSLKEYFSKTAIRKDIC